MGDTPHDEPQTMGLGSLNNVFQEPDNDKSPETVHKTPPPPSPPQPTPLPTTTITLPSNFVIPSSQDNLLTREKIIQKYSSSDNDIFLDIEDHPNSATRKRAKRSSRALSKKDKCPCQISDTSSWKPKCCKCNQTWHSACCNLMGIVSIIELENWECPWCYIPLFNDPSKPKTVTNVLKEICLDINSIQNKCDSFNLTDLQDQNQ